MSRRAVAILARFWPGSYLQRHLSQTSWTAANLSLTRRTASHQSRQAVFQVYEPGATFASHLQCLGCGARRKSRTILQAH